MYRVNTRIYPCDNALGVNYEPILKAREQRAAFGWHTPAMLTHCRVRKENGQDGPGQLRPPSKTKASSTTKQNKKGSKEVVSFMTYSKQRLALSRCGIIGKDMNARNIG